MHDRPDDRLTTPRRAVLTGTLGVLAASALAACTGGRPEPTPSLSTLPAVPRPSFAARPEPPGEVRELPPAVPGMALTVDDGTDGSVLAAYARFIAETGTHVTFFVNGVRDSWREHARQLRPLLRSGQAQLGNHTWSHPDLTKIPDDQVEEQLSRNHDFIADTFGVDPRPFYRPPYGAHDARVNAVADRLGYTVPVLWSASLEDPSPVSADRIVGRAEDAFRRGAIVLSHANHAGTTKALPRFGALLRERRLATYTLDEVWRSTAGATPSS